MGGHTRLPAAGVHQPWRIQGSRRGSRHLHAREVVLRDPVRPRPDVPRAGRPATAAIPDLRTVLHDQQGEPVPDARLAEAEPDVCIRRTPGARRWSWQGVCATSRHLRSPAHVAHIQPRRGRDVRRRTRCARGGRPAQGVSRVASGGVLRSWTRECAAASGEVHRDLPRHGRERDLRMELRGDDRGQHGRVIQLSRRVRYRQGRGIARRDHRRGPAEPLRSDEHLQQDDHERGRAWAGTAGGARPATTRHALHPAHRTVGVPGPGRAGRSHGAESRRRCGTGSGEGCSRRRRRDTVLMLTAPRPA
eukprot:Opistho-1_new@86318